MSAVGGCLQSSRDNGKTQQPLTLTSLQQQQQKLWPPWALYVWERQRTRHFWDVRQHLFHKAVSISWGAHQLFIEQNKNHLKRAYKAWFESGEVYWNSCRFHKLVKAIQNVCQKTVHRNTLCDGLMIMTARHLRGNAMCNLLHPSFPTGTNNFLLLRTDLILCRN